MSLAAPKVQLSIHAANIDLGDIAFIGVDLGCSKEVSAFDVLLFNNDKKYSEGATLIERGDSVGIAIGRDPNWPLLLTGSVERLEYEDAPEVNYLWVRGRCVGKNLFDRHFTGVYENKKGEYIIRDLIDNKTSLEHVRVNSLLTGDAAAAQKDVTVADGSKFSANQLVKIEDDAAWEYNEVSSIAGNVLTMVNNLENAYTVAANAKVWIDLIEKTDTTYTLLEYEDTPIWDILRYVAGSASKSGTIGFEMRVEYDGKFAFFPKETKTSPITLTDLIEKAQYIIDGERIRDWIKVRGAAEKPNVADKDFGTDMADPHTGSTVDQQSASGQKNLFVAATAPFDPDDKIFIYYGDRVEENEVDTIDAGVKLVCKNNLANTYPVASAVIVYPGWGPGTANTTIAADAATYLIGNRSIKVSRPDGPQIMAFYKPADHMDLNEFPSANWLWRVSKEITGNVCLVDVNGKYAYMQLDSQLGDAHFHFLSYGAGRKKEDGWEIESGFDWTDIFIIMFEVYDGNMDFWVDGLFLDHKRWEHTESNPYDPSNPRELIEIIEEFHSDNACELRAKALMAYYRPEMELVTVDSDLVDWGTDHPAAGDKVNVQLPNENLNKDFRIDALEINVIPEQVLDVRIKAGREPPLYVDFMFESHTRIGELMRGQLVK